VVGDYPTALEALSSGPGCPVPVRHHLIGLIRPTRRHIAISPQGGLYAMPSLCGKLVGFGLAADLVIWTAVGGRANIIGPVIGTLLVGSLTAQLRRASFFLPAIPRDDC
jgi:hypothetical protein